MTTFISAGVIHLVQYGILFVSTFWRYDHPGSVCSGDYLDADEVVPPNYMIHSGQMLNVWIIFQYVVMVLSCTIFWLVVCCTNCTKETCGRLCM